MKFFDGKKSANKILKELAENVKKSQIKPKLSVILVGDDEASKIYVNLKKKAAAKVGIGFEEFRFSAQARSEDIIAKIKELNSDETVSGVIVQLPLPAVFNADKIIDTIAPEKDVDGFHRENRKLLEKGKPRIMPVLPMAVLRAIQGGVKDLAGKEILALVNSEIFGQSLKLVLEKEGARVNFMVRNTCVVLGAEKDMRSADIIVTVCGCPSLIKDEMIKEGAVLIDGGITRYHDGRVVGDVDAQSVETKAAFLTPVPGGIGPLTVALLLKNVYLAASRVDPRV